MAEQSGEVSHARQDVRAVYEVRLADRNRALERWSKTDRRAADIRLVLFSVCVVLALLVYNGTGLSPWWISLPGAVFVALVFAHEPIRRASDRARRSVQFYSRGLARLDNRWAGTGVTGLEYLDLEHPYAADLDIFGVGSMFERLCTARTRAGEEMLASWLLAPASPEVIGERHAAISELRPRLDLREDLELLGVEVRAGIDPAALAAWGTSSRVFPGLAIPIAAATLGAIATAAVIGWLFFDTGLLPVLLVTMIEVTFARALSARVAKVLTALDRRTHDLVLLSELLGRLEGERFEAPLLARVVASLETRGLSASAQIRRLARLLNLLDYRRNQFFMPVAALWLWTTQLAVRIDAWRSGSGRGIAGWFSAIGEFEALCALAAYASENPTDRFPELIDGPACFQAESVGHALIPADGCVRNDVVLDGETRVMIVSGSNMSGKSTLLRTVGLSAVLALAGVPVRASRLRITPLAVGATLRIQDSLLAGRSRFYAEITRVRKLVDLARGPLPLLFLLDELFHGTNSHDRCVGAGSVVRGFINQGAIGLVTTHDLALAQIAVDLAPKATNVHFEDTLVDGRMTFDYQMRAGVVQHSNALALMRAIGLEV